MSTIHYAGDNFSNSQAIPKCHCHYPIILRWFTIWELMRLGAGLDQKPSLVIVAQRSSISWPRRCLVFFWHPGEEERDILTATVTVLLRGALSYRGT